MRACVTCGRVVIQRKMEWSARARTRGQRERHTAATRTLLLLEACYEVIIIFKGSSSDHASRILVVYAVYLSD